MSVSAQADSDPAMVRIPGKNYEMGKYDVTQKEWRDIMGSNPSFFAQCGDTCPVEQVSWDDVQEFLQKLNAKTGKKYRLPTEAEWEYACYGGNKTKFCGGNDINAVAWYGCLEGNSNYTTHPVGQKQANGYGLYDMSGNVYQWMKNKYDNEHGWRVIRGSTWDCIVTEDESGMESLSAAFHTGSEHTYRNAAIGFRLARTLP
jgi:formylglycine-generating enzyme required for sulfatase activity